MQITAEPLEPRQVRLTIVVPPERIEQAMHETAQEFARKLGVRGYRPGRVPVALVASQVGQDALRNETFKRLVNQVVNEAIDAEGLEPYGPLDVTRAGEDPLTYQAIVPLAPEVELGDYSTLKVGVPSLEEVSDAEVDEVIEGWLEDSAYLEPVERPASAGDVMTVTLCGRLDEKIVVDEEAIELPLTAEGARAANLPPEVVQHLIGLSPGEERAFAVTYSEFWPQPELQGRQVSFEAQVAGVSALRMPEPETLIEENEEIESVGELRQRVRVELQARAAIQANEAFQDAVLDALVSGARISYPPSLLESETAELFLELRDRVEREGFTWQRWLELQGKDEETLWRELEQHAEWQLRRTLALQEFIRAEGIRVSAEEVERAYSRLAEAVLKDQRLGKQARDELRVRLAARLLLRRALARLLTIAAEQGGSPSDQESQDAAPGRQGGEEDPDAEQSPEEGSAGSQSADSADTDALPH